MARTDIDRLRLLRMIQRTMQAVRKSEALVQQTKAVVKQSEAICNATTHLEKTMSKVTTVEG